MEPATGRFNRMDPVLGFVRNPVSLNKYIYANSDSINFIDPQGRFGFAQVVTVSGIIGGLFGLSVGTYLGIKENGSFFSWKTLEYAIFGLVAGIAGGVLVGAASYILTTKGIGALGKALEIGMEATVRKAMGTHSTSQSAMLIGFAAGFALGLLDPFDVPVLVTGFVTYAMIKIDDALMRSVRFRSEALNAIGGIATSSLALSAKKFSDVAQAYTFIGFYAAAGFAVGYTLGSFVGSLLQVEDSKQR